MNLPVADLEAALPFYEGILGFRLTARQDTPHKAAVLARDAIQIGLAENGGDPSQDGCAFHVKGLGAVVEEFQARGLANDHARIGSELRKGVRWRVFFVVAPDGLCYWFGES